MNAIKLDQLPDLCLRKIFAFLGLRDLARCRSVTHQFKFYADLTKVDELVVQDNADSCRARYIPECKNWYLTDRPINFDNSVSPNAFECVKSSPLKLDQQLKFLQVREEASFDLAILNCLTQLVHLEVKCRFQAPVILSLPNLKVLDVRATPFTPYVLKTPKLELLACQVILGIHVEYPEAIKRLSIELGGRLSPLTKFKNLEILDFQWIGINLDETLLSWKNLKELNLHIDPKYLSSYYERFKRSLTDFIRQRAALERDELKLYLEDVLLVDANQLPDYQTMLISAFMNNYSFWFMNWSKLRRDTYPSVKSLQFDYLMGLDVQLSEDFFRRFPAIENLTAIGSVNRDDFEWFVKKATALRSLTLVDTSLDQTTMENLSKICPQLTHLEVQGSSDLVTDFNFVLELKHLKMCKTDQQIDSFDLAEKGFQQLEELAIFYFRAGEEGVDIERLTSDEYNLSLWSYLDNKPCVRTFSGRNWLELVSLLREKTRELSEPVV